MGSSNASFSLTTAPDQFTDLAWDLLLAAQDQARRWRHGELDVEHLLQAFLEEPRCAELMAPYGFNQANLLDAVDDFCAQQPTRSSSTLYVGEALELLLDGADQARERQGLRRIDGSPLWQALQTEPRIGAALFGQLQQPVENKPAEQMPINQQQFEQTKLEQPKF